MNTQSTLSFLDPALLRPSLVQAFAKLDPRVQWRNPVMFVVYAGSILTSVLWLLSLGSAAVAGSEGSGFILAMALWLWFTAE